MRADARLTVRMPTKLQDRITDQAKANGMTINAYILQVLENGLDHPPLLAETPYYVIIKPKDVYQIHRSDNRRRNVWSCGFLHEAFRIAHTLSREDGLSPYSVLDLTAAAANELGEFLK